MSKNISVWNIISSSLSPKELNEPVDQDLCFIQFWNDLVESSPCCNLNTQQDSSTWSAQLLQVTGNAYQISSAAKAIYQAYNDEYLYKQH